MQPQRMPDQSRSEIAEKAIGRTLSQDEKDLLSKVNYSQDPYSNNPEDITSVAIFITTRLAEREKLGILPINVDVAMKEIELHLRHEGKGKYASKFLAKAYFLNWFPDIFARELDIDRGDFIPLIKIFEGAEGDFEDRIAEALAVYKVLHEDVQVRYLNQDTKRKVGEAKAKIKEKKQKK